MGKTPLTGAVRFAAEMLLYREGKATVILVSDYAESCNADPCALGVEHGGVESVVQLRDTGTRPCSWRILTFAVRVASRRSFSRTLYIPVSVSPGCSAPWIVCSAAFSTDSQAGFRLCVAIAAA
jgi:hypothetical protein